MVYKKIKAKKKNKSEEDQEEGFLSKLKNKGKDKKVSFENCNNSDKKPDKDKINNLIQDIMLRQLPNNN